MITILEQNKISMKYWIVMEKKVIEMGYKACRVRVENINTLRLTQNDHHFPDNIFKCIFFNENVWISIQISLKFVFKHPINNNTPLVQIMARHQPDNKPLSEPMMA